MRNQLIVYDGSRKAIAFPIFYFQATSGNHTKTLRGYMMNLIKKAVLTLTIAISLGASNVAFAVDPASRVVAHLEQAVAEIVKHDFNGAYLHEKAARESSNEITGNADKVKEGLASIIKAQIIGKSADEEKATAELNKAIAIFKSI
jgi:hypothetical protein